jgi:hypothetical protein
MTRKALVVGIDHYTSTDVANLFGCVADAHDVKAVLDRNSDGTVNFAVRLIVGSGPSEAVSRRELKQAVEQLFSDDAECALLYFAGHGYIEATGGYILSSDSTTGDEGLPLTEVLTLANQSKAKNKIIILDSCHSGYAGSHPVHGNVAELSDGMTILTASTTDQYAAEDSDGGVFTTLLVDALNGAAGNLVGDVTPGGIYSHIDQSLGPWEQRPVFKTNVKSFVSLRKVQPPIALAELQQLAKLFPAPGYEFRLDSSFEPEGPNPDPNNTITFAILQNLNRVNLVVPIDAPHMYHAAMGDKSCKLTVLGEHYRRLVERGRI